jgi:pimeloyl-ACP methyl ester carboxylesterase
VLLGVLVALDDNLAGHGAHGLLDLGLAGSREEAREILRDWGPSGRGTARWELWLAFPYSAAYGSFWALSALAIRDLARRRHFHLLAAAGNLAARLAAIAALLNVAQIAALLLVLGGHGGRLGPEIAAICLRAGLAAIGVAILYVLAVLVRLAYRSEPIATAVGLGTVGAVWVALIVIALVAGGETAPASARTGEILHLPGGDLHVSDVGPRRSSALVLIHGYAVSMAWWEPVASIVDRSRRVIRVDLLGFGGSQKPSAGYGMQNQARLVLAALRQLGVLTAVVAGHSMGGEVAVAMAAQDRAVVRGVAVLDTPPNASFENASLVDRMEFASPLGPALFQLAPDSALRSKLQAGVAPGIKIPEQFVHDLRRATWTALTSSAASSREYLEERPLDQRMAPTHRPLLVIFGLRDGLVAPAAAGAWKVPGEQVVRLPGVGHSPEFERPQRTASLLADFARSTLGA